MNQSCDFCFNILEGFIDICSVDFDFENKKVDEKLVKSFKRKELVKK